MEKERVLQPRQAKTEKGQVPNKDWRGGDKSFSLQRCKQKDDKDLRKKWRRQGRNSNQGRR